MFFIYEHWRPDTGQCFYVGKGTMRGGKPIRAFEMTHGRNKHHRSVVEKLRIRGLSVDVRVIFHTESEGAAFAKEIELIARWRAAGTALVNSASGGGKNSGWKLSEERKKMVSESKRGNKHRLGAILSDDTKRKISISSKGKTYSQAYKDAMAIACAGEKNGFFGKTHSDETRAKVADSNRKRVWTAESRAKLSASLRARNANRGS
jgi:NUMOD3 motif